MVQAAFERVFFLPWPSEQFEYRPVPPSSTMTSKIFSIAIIVIIIVICVFVFVCVYVYDVCGKVHISQRVCGGQRTAMWRQFSLCRFPCVPEVRLLASHGKRLVYLPVVSELGREAAVTGPESETLP